MLEGEYYFAEGSAPGVPQVSATAAGRDMFNDKRDFSGMKTAIKNYLDNRAKTDELFAAKYANPKKSIDECCKYITGEAYARAKDGTAVISDEEVYGMAVHYYDEETVEIRKQPAGTKVSAGTKVPSKTTKVKLTKAEEEEARKKALNDIYEAERKRLLAKPKKTKTEELQPMLFDF